MLDRRSSYTPAHSRSLPREENGGAHFAYAVDEANLAGIFVCEFSPAFYDL